MDQAFGDVTAFVSLVARAHDLGLRVFIDLVPNHTSSEHPWFRAARSSRRDPQRGWYHWRDGAPGGGPPNNWESVFGGPAWTYDDATAQWWLHLFLPQQPDLNWSEPAVARAFDEILDCWFARGVDGVRIDVAHGLVKHPDLPDLPVAATPTRRAVGVSSTWAALDHVHDRDQEDVLDVYRRWRPRFDAADAVALGEVYLEDPARVVRYVRDGDGLHASFWFPLQQAEWDAGELRAAIADGLTAGSVRGRAGAATAWVLDSHDVGRSATRFGGGLAGARRSLAAWALLAFLPGVPFLYQGQELGLTDVAVEAHRARDPIALRFGELDRGRDRARTPMPWTPGPGMGFTPAGVEPWLPFGLRSDADTVAVQRRDPASLLHGHRALIAARRRWRPSAATSVTWLEVPEDVPEDVIAYRRGDLLVAANCGARTALVPLPDRKVRWSTPGLAVERDAGALSLPADAAVVAGPA